MILIICFLMDFRSLSARGREGTVGGVSEVGKHDSGVEGFGPSDVLGGQNAGSSPPRAGGWGGGGREVRRRVERTREALGVVEVVVEAAVDPAGRDGREVGGLRTGGRDWRLGGGHVFDEGKMGVAKGGSTGWVAHQGPMVHFASGKSFCVAMAQMCAVVCLILSSSSDSSLVRSLIGSASASPASGSATALTTCLLNTLVA